MTGPYGPTRELDIAFPLRHGQRASAELVTPRTLGVAQTGRDQIARRFRIIRRPSFTRRVGISGNPAAGMGVLGTGHPIGCRIDMRRQRLLTGTRRRQARLQATRRVINLAA